MRRAARPSAARIRPAPAATGCRRRSAAPPPAAAAPPRARSPPASPPRPATRDSGHAARRCAPPARGSRRSGRAPRRTAGGHKARSDPPATARRRAGWPRAGRRRPPARSRRPSDSWCNAGPRRRSVGSLSCRRWSSAPDRAKLVPKAVRGVRPANPKVCARGTRISRTGRTRCRRIFADGTARASGNAMVSRLHSASAVRGSHQARPLHGGLAAGRARRAEPVRSPRRRWPPWCARDAPARHTVAFVWAAAVTLALYFNFAWFREQLCVVLCPYGRRSASGRARPGSTSATAARPLDSGCASIAPCRLTRAWVTPFSTSAHSPTHTYRWSSPSIDAIYVPGSASRSWSTTRRLTSPSGRSFASLRRGRERPH